MVNNGYDFVKWKNGLKSKGSRLPGCLLAGAEEEIRTPTPGKRRYHLKVVRLPISPPPQQGCNLVEKVDYHVVQELINELIQHQPGGRD